MLANGSEPTSHLRQSQELRALVFAYLVLCWPQPVLAIATLTGPVTAVTEGDNAEFTVTVSGITTNPVTVTYQIAGNSSSTIGDFATATGTARTGSLPFTDRVTVSAGTNVTAVITVAIFDDTAMESEETFTVSLIGASGSTTVSSTTVTVTIFASDTTCGGVPPSNTGLHMDCEVLLAARDTLRGTARLNWARGTPICSWAGVWIPSCRLPGEFNRVTTLTLSRSRLNGTIPAVLSRMDSLLRLDLQINELTGSIPAALGTTTNLDRLLLNHNQLSGTIPAELGKTQLTHLHLNNNQLSGTIPAELGNPRFISLRLNNNQLSGTIPNQFSRLDLIELQLENNQLSGSFPAFLTRLAQLARISLHNNRFTGCIPRSFPTRHINPQASGNLSVCPLAPARLMVTAGDRQATLSWNNPGDSSITGYQVRYRADGSDYTAWADISGSSATTTSHVVTSLINGNHYVFQLRAVTTGAGLSTDTARILIDLGAISLAAPTTATEEGTEALFKVSVPVAPMAALTVSYAVTGTAATSDRDATAADFAGRSFPASTVTIRAGATMATVTIGIADDTIYEPTEHYRVTLSNPQPGAGETTTYSAGTSALADIAVSDRTIFFDYTRHLRSGLDEGRSLPVSIRRFGAAQTEAITVTYRISGTDITEQDFSITADGTPIASLTGTTEIAATNRFVADTDLPLRTRMDGAIEAQETATITLLGASGGGGTHTNNIDSRSSSVNAIIKADVVYTIASAVRVTEGATAGFSVTADRKPSSAKDITCTAGLGTAGSRDLGDGSSDIVPAATTLTFRLSRPLIQNCAFATFDDTLNEPDETFTVTITGSDGTDDSGTVTITDNDAITVSIARIDSGDLPETSITPGDNDAVFRVTLAGGQLTEEALIPMVVAGDIVADEVNYQISPDSVRFGGVPIGRVLIIPATVSSGPTTTVDITVTPVNDNLNEPAETVELKLRDSIPLTSSTLTTAGRIMLSRTVAELTASATIAASDSYDMNEDGTLDRDDALIMYYAYTLSDLLSTNRFVRRNLLAGLVDRRITSPSDSNYLALLHNAAAWQRLGVAVGGDLNNDRSVDAKDALIMYYAYSFDHLLGSGRSSGSSRLRAILLYGLEGKLPATDTTYRQLLRNAKQLKAHN